MSSYNKKITPQVQKPHIIKIYMVDRTPAFTAERVLEILETIRVGVMPGVDDLVPDSTDLVPEMEPVTEVFKPEKPTQAEKGPMVQPVVKPSFIPKPLPPNKIESYTILKKYVDRLPVAIEYSPEEHGWFMNNRAKFLSFMDDTLSHYNKDLADEKLNLDCSKSDTFTLLSHQKIVRDYINVFTPYRGLLLYHGLGSGKTCSSIAIAEGIKHNKNVMIMIPASLRSNYIKELKFCGDIYYKKKQFWEWVPAPTTEEIKSISYKTSLTERYIKKQGGVWLVDIREKANYDTLTASDQASLDDQLNEQIFSKYQFVNYNGLTKTNWYRHLCKSGKMKDGDCADGINPFDNKVVIIDEAHNFISRIANKLKDPTQLFMKLYKYLILAENCKIVLLTGTPVVNYPNEVGILFNILRGAISTWKIDVTINAGAKKVDLQAITKLIRQNELLASSIDYINYQVANKKLILTRNPLGFDSTYSTAAKLGTGYTGVKINRKVKNTDKVILDELKSVLAEHKIILSDIKVEKHNALPDTLENFITEFVGENGKLKNKNKLQKRIIGLISYFPDLVKLMPRFNKEDDIEEVLVPMSNHQLSIYEKERTEERKTEVKKAKPKKAKHDAMYNESPSTYRIFSRSSCNFVFPTYEDKPKRNFEEDSSDQQIKPDALSKSALLNLVKKADTIFSASGLARHSPKFLRILQNIQNPKHVGLHLLYSAFRSLEGIGIFKSVLDYHGYSEFKLKKVAGVWTLDSLDISKQHYALYTGTEDATEKEIIRNIYNGEWELVPTNIRDELLKTYTTNKMGEIIKVVMITAAGAEGISLRNTRYVHIMEPYWHPVRIDQVIGRARRICSHNELEVEFQTVKVFLYLAVFSDEQLDKTNKTTGLSKELRCQDISKFDKTQIQTTDQYIYEVANKKRKINEEILDTLKDSSIDCKLHEDDDNRRNCKKFTNIKASTFSYEPNITKDDNDNAEELNITNELQVYKPLLDGIEQLNNHYKRPYFYIFNNKTLDIIRLPPTITLDTLTSDNIAREGIMIGKIVRDKDGKDKIHIS